MIAIRGPRFAPVLLVAVFVAACGGSTESAGASPAGATPAGPGPTDAPVTDAPPAEPGSSTIVLPSFLNGDEDLEAVLPDEIGGLEVTKFSVAGDEFLTQGSGDMQAVLDSLGKSPSDLSAAFASAGTTSIVVFRISGANAGDIFNAFVAASQEDVGELTDVSIAGKQVKKSVDDTGDASYLYFVNDMVFAVASAIGSPSDEILNEVFGKLP